MDSLDAEEQTAMHDALHHVLTTVAASGAHLHFGICQDCAYLGEAMRLGWPAPWREVWHRLKTVASEDEAIEAIGDLRELLVEEDLLLPDGETR